MINKELSEREIEKIIPFTVALNRIKYFGVNLNKEAKTYTWKVIRHWWKKLNTTETCEKIYHDHGLEDLILLKWQYYKNQSLSDIKTFSIELDQIILKFI